VLDAEIVLIQRDVIPEKLPLAQKRNSLIVFTVKDDITVQINRIAEDDRLQGLKVEWKVGDFLEITYRP